MNKVKIVSMILAVTMSFTGCLDFLDDDVAQTEAELAQESGTLTTTALVNKTIDLDSLLADWNTVTPMFTDPENDVIDGNSSSDITNVYIVQDDINLYARLDLLGDVKFPHHTDKNTSYYSIQMNAHKNVNCSDNNASYYVLNTLTDANGENYGPIFNNYVDNINNGIYLESKVTGNTIEFLVPLYYFNSEYKYISVNPQVKSLHGRYIIHDSIADWSDYCFEVKF